MAVADDNQHLTRDASPHRTEARLLWSEINRSNSLLKLTALIAVVLLAVSTVLRWLDIPHWPMWR